MGRGGWTFFQAFLKSPRIVASVVPSSHFLENRLVVLAELAQAGTVVELGAGSGGTTRAFLAALAADARLIAIERTARFAEDLRALSDPRLEVIHGCASDIGRELEARGLDGADAVISGIPFSTMPPELAQQIVEAVRDALNPGGLFVAYQFTDRVADYMTPVMGPPRIERELCNIPPVRIFIWRKPVSGNQTESAKAVADR